MTNYKKQLVSVVAAGTMLLNVAAPALADTTIQISGNGAGSDNYTKVEQSNTSAVSQSNTANVTNNVTSNASTGGNGANFNTGGAVTISTGDAKTTANVSNTLNSNVANVDGCCAQDTDVLISGNGAYSDNVVTLSNTNSNAVEQSNVANVTNNVYNKASTGGNDANLNTGGDVIIATGNAEAHSNVSTTANSNSAMIGGGAGSAMPTASFRILGNGAGSANWIDATLSNENAILQSNEANVENNVTSKAKTGYNDANFNTGGDVIIATGNAKSSADVDNMVNFNVANVDCGCVFDVLAKIDGNGASPSSHWNWFKKGNDNTILLDLTNSSAIGQDNLAYLANNVEAKAKTGGNESEKNTGSVENGDDPAIITGDATNSTDVNNSGNVNSVGGEPFVISLPGGTNVGLSFDVQALLAFFGLSIH